MIRVRRLLRAFCRLSGVCFCDKYKSLIWLQTQEMGIAYLAFLCLIYSVKNGDTEKLKDESIESLSVCTTREDCDVKANTDSTGIGEHTKYLIDRTNDQHEVHKHDDTANRSNKILKEKLAEIRRAVVDLEQWLDASVNEVEKHDGANVGAASKETENQETSADQPAVYEFPPLTRVDPGKVSQYLPFVDKKPTAKTQIKCHTMGIQ